MSAAAELRAALATCRKERVELEARGVLLDTKVAVLLRKVPETPHVSIAEAAEILGISRTTAHKLIRGEG